MAPKRKSTSSASRDSSEAKKVKGDTPTVVDLLQPDKPVGPWDGHLTHGLSDTPYLAGYFASVDSHADLIANPAGAIEAFTLYFRHMADEEPSTTRQSIFAELRSVKTTLQELILGYDGIDIEATVSQSMLLEYQEERLRFVNTWRLPMMNMLETKFDQLRHVLRTGELSLELEFWFHAVFDCLLLLFPIPLAARRLDESIWWKYAPIFAEYKEFQASYVQLKRHYQEFQYKTYGAREDTKLWLLIWRSLRLISSTYEGPGHKFPNSWGNMKYEVETAFFAMPMVHNMFPAAEMELGAQQIELVEMIVAQYCEDMRIARSYDPDCVEAYRAIPDTELHVTEEEELNELLAKRQVSAGFMWLLQRATSRLASLKSTLEGDLAWYRRGVNGRPTTWPLIGQQARGMPSEVATEFRGPELDGNEQICSFDYVHFPFPETRAHEFAASEQITREMSEPGITSDGARVQYLVNRPQRHARPPNQVSSWARFQLRGPIGIMRAIAHVAWKWKFGRRRPATKSRAGLTHRPDRIKMQVGPLSPRKDSARRVSKTAHLPQVPKLRGGGDRQPRSSVGPQTPGRPRSDSPRRPSYSPITEPSSPAGRCTRSDGSSRRASSRAHPRPYLTEDQMAIRVDQFNDRTGSSQNLLQRVGIDQVDAQEFLAEHNWDVDAAVDEFHPFARHQLRLRRISHNNTRTNFATPTPELRIPPMPRPARASPARSTPVNNTGARLGIYNDHDDEEEDDTSDTRDTISVDSDPGVPTPGTDNYHAASSNEDIYEDDELSSDEHDEDEDEDKDEEDSEEEQDRRRRRAGRRRAERDTPPSQGYSASNGSSDKENEAHDSPQIKTRDSPPDGATETRNGRAPSASRRGGLFEDDGPASRFLNLKQTSSSPNGLAPWRSGVLGGILAPAINNLPRPPVFGSDDWLPDQQENPAPQPGLLNFPPLGRNPRDNSFQPKTSVQRQPLQPRNIQPQPPLFGTAGTRPTPAQQAADFERVRALHGFGGPIGGRRTPAPPPPPPPPQAPGQGQVPGTGGESPEDGEIDSNGENVQPDPRGLGSPYHTPPPQGRRPLGVLQDRGTPDSDLPPHGPCHPCPQYPDQYHHVCHCAGYDLNGPHGLPMQSPFRGIHVDDSVRDRRSASRQRSQGSQPPRQPPRGVQPPQDNLPQLTETVGVIDGLRMTPRVAHDMSRQTGVTARELSHIRAAIRLRDGPQLDQLVRRYTNLHLENPLRFEGANVIGLPMPFAMVIEVLRNAGAAPAALARIINAMNARDELELDNLIQAYARQFVVDRFATIRFDGNQRPPPADGDDLGDDLGDGEGDEENDENDENAPSAPRRAPISAAEYQATMFGHEMAAELEARGIEMPRTATVAARAELLHQADLDGNLGWANLYAYRVITGNRDARSTARGWKMPARPKRDDGVEAGRLVMDDGSVSDDIDWFINPKSKKK